MPADLIPYELAEEVLGSVGDALDEKLGTKKWVKPLYWTAVTLMFLSVGWYYFWS